MPVTPDNVEIRAVDSAPSLGGDSSPFEDWGVRDADAQPRDLERWVIVVDGEIVGDLSAHGHYYGPTAGSRAMNIGITVAQPCLSSGVFTGGGQTQTMRTPRPRFSWCSTSAKAETANFEAL